MSIKIEHLSKSFGKKNIFADFNCTFADSGIYVISGESGAGKTTLLRIIAGLDKDYTGTVDRSTSGVSVCFQEYRLFDSITALKNVTEVSFKKATAGDFDDVKKLFERLNLSDEDVNLYPPELSGGMKQRVAFIRAIAKKAPLLILDEPTKEVDSENASIMKQIIKEEGKKRLVIMVTHKQEDILDTDATIIDISTH